jgi:hypothetical protein
VTLQGVGVIETSGLNDVFTGRLHPDIGIPAA